MSFLTAENIHARIDWPAVLERLGVPGTGTRKAGPCPACGGTDRFVGDNRHGHGDYFCRQCGPGDGFQLLRRVHGWTFAIARRRVIEAAGLDGNLPGEAIAVARAQPGVAREAPATPTARVRDLARGCCPVDACPPVVDYLTSRGLWPLPAKCSLRAHAGAEYFEERQRIGRYPALVASVRDVNGSPVTAHVTYLKGGRKLEDHAPRKLLSPLTARIGCAVRLAPLVGETLGIAEGVETALAAQALHGVPTWAAINAPLLAKFEPPTGVHKLVVYADRDVAGLEAAARLMERLQGRAAIELCLPRAQFKDWNEQLLAGVAA